MSIINAGGEMLQIACPIRSDGRVSAGSNDLAARCLTELVRLNRLDLDLIEGVKLANRMGEEKGR